MKKGEVMVACTQCGKCCVDFSVPGVGFCQLAVSLREYPYLEYIGLRRAGKHLVPKFRCARLLRVNGHTVCAEYSSRPDFCRQFPGASQPRPEGCSM